MAAVCCHGRDVTVDSSGGSWRRWNHLLSLNHKRYQALIQLLESETDVTFVEPPAPSDAVCVQVLQMILLHFHGLQFTSLRLFHQRISAARVYNFNTDVLVAS